MLWSGLIEMKQAHPGLRASFASRDGAEFYLREVCASFGPLAEEQWRHVAEHSTMGQGDERGHGVPKNGAALKMLSARFISLSPAATQTKSDAAIGPATAKRTKANTRRRVRSETW